jgi:hypothetical protein
MPVPARLTPVKKQIETLMAELSETLANEFDALRNRDIDGSPRSFPGSNPSPEKSSTWALSMAAQTWARPGPISEIRPPSACSLTAPMAALSN